MYPHRGSYTERLEDVVRVIKKTGRPNVGATFTLCHFLAVDDARNLDRVLQLAKPYLNMVNINGTDGYDPKNRAGWIQTLDQGSFDLVTVLKALRKVDYRGPIGLIAFGIKGDRRDIIARSIKAWKELSAKAASDSGSR
jgi:sugar phosphate isomerase/epimerase